MATTLEQITPAASPQPLHLFLSEKKTLHLFARLLAVELLLLASHVAMQLLLALELLLTYMLVPGCCLVLGSMASGSTTAGSQSSVSEGESYTCIFCCVFSSLYSLID